MATDCGRVRKRIIRVIMFLLLGAVVNVAVAWGLYCIIRPRNTDTQVIQDHGEVIRIWTRFLQLPTDINLRLSMHADMGGSYAIVMGDGHRPPYVVELQAGWPWRTFVGQMPGVGPDESEWVLNLRSMRMTRQTDDWNRTWNGVPCYPLWQGFIINTLFYATVLWCLFTAFIGLRRRRREKWGLCGACGYPVGKSEICTECGKAVTSRNVGDES